MFVLSLIVLISLLSHQVNSQCELVYAFKTDNFARCFVITAQSLYVTLMCVNQVSHSYVITYSSSTHRSHLFIFFIKSNFTYTDDSCIIPG